MRTFLFITTLFVCLCSSAQKDEPITLKNTLPLPEAGQWTHTASTPGIKAMTGRSIMLVTYWNAGDAEVTELADELSDVIKEHSVILPFGVHIPLQETEKDSAFVSHMASQYGLTYPHLNDVSGHYTVPSISERLPRYVLIHPNGTEQVLYEGGKKLIDGDLSSYVTMMVAKITAEFTGPGNTLFQTGTTPPPLTEKDYSILSYPHAVEVDQNNGYIFISDTKNHRIVICDSDGNVIDCIGSGNQGNEDGHFRNCVLNGPQGMSFDADNNLLYIADTGNNTIRLAKLDEQQLVTIYGNGSRAWESETGIKGKNNPLSRPTDVWLDGYRLIVTMSGANQFWDINIENLNAISMAGTGQKRSAVGKRIKDVDIAVPGSLVIDADNRILFSDAQTHAIYTIEKGRVKYLLGEDGIAGLTEGDFESARIMRPSKMVVKKNDVYLVDQYAARISTLDIDKRTIRTLELPAGDTLSGPTDIDWLDGKLIICDQHDNQILTEKNGILEGIKLTGYDRLNSGFRRADQLNMAQEIILNESGQNTVNIEFKLPDEYLWDIDNQSTLFSTQSEEIYIADVSLGAGEKEFIVFPDKLRFQITLMGELNFCSVLDPSKCFHKNLNVVIPVQKSADAEFKHSTTITLLPELMEKKSGSDQQLQEDDWLKY